MCKHAYNSVPVKTVDRISALHRCIDVTYSLMIMTAMLPGTIT